MASRLPSVTDKENFVLNNETITAHTKRAITFGFSLRTNIFLSEFAENAPECSSKKSESARGKNRNQREL